MRSRIICLFHAEDSPSLVRLKDGWRCYGACQRTYTHEEVEKASGSSVDYVKPDADREDLTESFEYINSLPVADVRGLKLRTSKQGYYIVWPNNEYYKYRLFNPTGPKYIGPKGIKPPLFLPHVGQSRHLMVSEGEINCLSLVQAFPDYDHCSPGSASMFNSKELEKNLTKFVAYDTVTVVLDNDPAGIKALIETKSTFLYKIPFAKYLLLNDDPNEVLVSHGKNELRQRLLRTDSK